MKYAMAVSVSALLITGALFPPKSLAAGEKEATAQTSESLVSCLLPSAIRKYSGDSVMLAPRRVVEIPAAECQQRGGEIVVVEPAK